MTPRRGAARPRAGAARFGRGRQSRPGRPGPPAPSPPVSEPSVRPAARGPRPDEDGRVRFRQGERAGSALVFGLCSSSVRARGLEEGARGERGEKGEGGGRERAERGQRDGRQTEAVAPGDGRARRRGRAAPCARVECVRPLPRAPPLFVERLFRVYAGADLGREAAAVLISSIGVMAMNKRACFARLVGCMGPRMIWGLIGVLTPSRWV